MRYWRFLIGIAFVIAAVQFAGSWECYVALAAALLSLFWGFQHMRSTKRKQEKWKKEHPFYDPHYEFSRFELINTQVVDEEGDRQAALARFRDRIDEFEGDISGSITALGTDENGEVNGYGVYLNGTRMGDAPMDEVRFIRNRARHLETFNKIMLTNWEEGSSGPLGLLVSLRFPRNRYEAPAGSGPMLSAGSRSPFS